MDNFKLQVVKARGPKIHKIRNSWGVYDAYKWIRKNNWLDIGRTITQHQFYFIIRNINKELVQQFFVKQYIKFPHKMGKLELAKTKAKVSIKNGKLKISKIINWGDTLEYWKNDQEAFNNKTLIYNNAQYIFKIIYSKYKANYKNKQVFFFYPNRTFKRQLAALLKDNKIDTWLYG